MTTPPTETVKRNRFRTSDGVSISYRVWGDPSGRPAVLQHGFASDTDEEWVGTGVVQALTRAGTAVIGVDSRGHGASDASHNAGAYGRSRSAIDILELTTALGVAEFDLGGYSMGAVIASTVAAIAPGRVRRLVLGGIGSSLVELGGVDTRFVSTADLVDTFRTEDPNRIVDPGLSAWRASVDAAGWDRAALALVAEAMEDGGVDVSDIVAPTLLLAGDRDPFAADPLVVIEAMAHARLVVLPGDHTQARYSPLFAASIVDFFTAS